MELTPDGIVYARWGPVVLNATLVSTWVTMLLLVGGSWIATRTLADDRPVGPWRSLVELLVVRIRGQIEEATGADADRYLPFVGTLFLFIAASTLLGVVPGLHAPAASLSTASALALAVFLAVPAFGIAAQGPVAYLAHYVRPNALMLPFHVIGELSRTLSLAIRLFGNLMSGRLVVAILVSVAPVLFPFLMEAFGLLIGLIQAYVFAVLSLVYIASGARATGGSDARVVPGA